MLHADWHYFAKLFTCLSKNSDIKTFCLFSGCTVQVLLALWILRHDIENHCSYILGALMPDLQIMMRPQVKFIYFIEFFVEK